MYLTCGWETQLVAPWRPMQNTPKRSEPLSPNHWMVDYVYELCVSKRVCPHGFKGEVMQVILFWQQKSKNKRNT